MEKLLNKPPLLQYALIRPFSENVWSNINQVFKTLFPEYINPEEPIPDPSGIAPSGNYFEITYNSNYVTISPGICVMNGVMIEIESSKTLPINNRTDGYYLSTSGDTLPQQTPGLEGPYYAYVAVYYDYEDRPDAYITLVGRHSIYALNRQHLCILGVLECYYRTSELTIEGFKSYHPVTGVSRQYLPGFMDGGWVYDRCMMATSISLNWDLHVLDFDVPPTNDILDGGTYA